MYVCITTYSLVQLDKKKSNSEKENNTVTATDHVSLIITFKHKTISMAVYRVLVGKPEGKRPLGRSRCRCEDNIKV